MTERTKKKEHFMPGYISKYHVYNTNCGEIDINDSNYLKQALSVQINCILH